MSDTTLAKNQKERNINRSYNFNRALHATLSKDLEEHPRDPIYFEYDGKTVRIVNWAGFSGRIKKWSDGATAFSLNTLNGYNLGDIVDVETFSLKPLGRIRQRANSNGLKVDYFEPVAEIDRLFKRLERMIKKNQERWDIEDGRY